LLVDSRRGPHIAVAEAATRRDQEATAVTAGVAPPCDRRETTTTDKTPTHYRHAAAQKGLNITTWCELNVYK